VGHVALPIDQHAHLAANLPAQLRELARKLVAEEDVRVQAATEQALELLGLAGLQTASVAIDLDVGLLGAKRFGSDAKTLALTRTFCTRPAAPRGYTLLLRWPMGI